MFSSLFITLVVPHAECNFTAEDLPSLDDDDGQRFTAHQML